MVGPFADMVVVYVERWVIEHGAVEGVNCVDLLFRTIPEKGVVEHAAAQRGSPRS
jgi:hypothetical protein